MPTTLTHPGDDAEARAPSEPPAFPVVGIGASAGGLQAFRTLLEHLPADTGLAYVVLPHLDPSHPSVMADILARDTAMPVHQVLEGEVAVEPDHVYVIAPNTLLTMTRGRLRVASADETGADRHACIDHFLRSLARTYREQAIAVILSGSASDGSDGIRAIKAAGGTTFVQDESAQFPDMPRNAAATGCADFVLPPRGIAEEIARLARHPLPPAPEAPPAADSAIQRIHQLLHGATGVDFSEYKQTTIRRRMARRMALLRIETPEAYLAWLEDHPREVRALHDDILINVTSFFREPAVFEALKTTVFPQLVRDRPPDEAVRIWVPGCSTGEEAFSLAIALIEFFEEHHATVPAQIFGTDVSESAVERARSGIFDASIEAEVSPERLRRFFHRLSRGVYQVAKPVRDLCVFARHDLTRDPPFSRLDLLSCRNVLIYLGTSLQRRVLPTLHYALKPTGFLLLGPSESVGPFGNLFSVVDKEHNLYAKLPAPPPVRLDLLLGPPRPSTGPTEPAEPPEFDLGREADRLLLARFAPAAMVVSDAGDILHVRGETTPYLRPAPGKASLHLLKMVREDLLIDVERALRDAREKGAAVVRDGIPIRRDERWRAATVEVVPIPRPGTSDLSFLVVFREPRPGVEAPETGAGGSAEEIGRLREELVAARAHHQGMLERYEASNEALRAAHEEVLSANEELQSTNEELETAKEELQSTNEELATLNDELQHRNTELAAVNSDIENVLANVDVPIAVVDSQLRLRRFTPAAERIFNVLPSDVNRRITDFQHTLAIDDLEKTLQHVLETLEPVDREIQDREGRWYALRVRPFRVTENRIEGAVLVLADIHALKVSLIDTARARTFMESIVEAVPECMLVLDASFELLLANPAYCRAFATRPEEVVGRSVFALDGGRWDLPRLRELLAESLARGTPFDALEVQQPEADGTTRTLLLNGRLVTREGRKLLLLTVEDITERRRAEAELRASEARMSAIFRQAVAGIVLTDPHGRFLMANRRFCEIVGRTPEEVLALNIADIVAPEDIARIQALLERLPGGGATVGLEQRLLRPDGSDVWVSIDASMVEHPVEHPPEPSEGILVILQNVTERRRAEQALRDLTADLDHRVRVRTAELEEVVRDLTQFSFTVSHDLRAPLRAMASFSHLLLEEYQGKPLEGRGLDYVRRIQTSAARMDALTESLLAYSRVGRMELKLEDVELHAVVADVLGQLEDELSRAHATVTYDAPADGAYVVAGHRVILGQVVTNLVRNAVKFVAPGVEPRVRIVPERRDERVRVWVEDNGIGIPPAYQDRVFGVFERLHTAEEYPGAGIGLAIVRRAVERMGGSVGVESAVGAGSRFWFELPTRVGP